MASSSSPLSAGLCLLVVVGLSLLSVSSSSLSVSSFRPNTPVVAGLSWNFHDSSCPDLESIVRKQLKKVIKDDVGQAAGLLRLQFHDCFVKGCDGSVLLDGSAAGPSEKSAIPNLTLRKQAFKIVDDLRRRVHRACGRVVSCSDIVALAARDSVVLTGGPDYAVPLGRRDGLNFATEADTFVNLVAPSANTTTVLVRFAAKRLDTVDSVALSGGHTIGISHCPAFTDRLYPTQDPTMDKSFANRLKVSCPAPDTNNTVDLDIRSPNTFDNKYFVDLMNRQGLFTSDQDLYTDRRTRGIVTDFAINQDSFFQKFAIAMVKMGQADVLTGVQGEIRANCSVRNSNNLSLLKQVVEDEVVEMGLF